ncbi:hypothetical protein [Chroococcidiopsis sp.]|uniref:hypothetical protein n=1 Tax=Chroococcidiopsis sp. TaxID=3088168 RepID=UPI003F34B6AB
MPCPLYTKRANRSILQPATQDYRARIIQVGGSINTSSLKAVDNFVKECKIDGIWDLLLDVGVFAGNSLNSALVKLKYIPGKQLNYSNFGYSGGNYSENQGILGAANKYLNSRIAINDLGATPTVAFYLREGNITGGTNNWYLGAGGSNGTFLGRGASNSQDVFNHSINSTYATVTQSSTAGFWGGSRFANDNQRLYKNGVPIATSTASTTVNTGTLDLYAAAYNLNGTAFGHLTKRFSFVAFSSLMTDAQMLLFYQRVQALQTALGRQV